MHSTTCERCSKPLNIEYKDDGSISYGCPGHIGGFASSPLYGYSPKYCPHCYEERRNERSVPCCVCQQKNGPALNMYREYHFWGGGTAIHLYCNTGAREKAFLALPVSHQAFYIRQRCDLAFPRRQVIYGLVDPESRAKCYIGRTHDQKKRLQHLKDRSEGLTCIGENQYYGKANWMHDLHMKGLQPTMEILQEVEISPLAIEWERRYILHGLQQGWPLTNHEASIETLVAKVRASQLDFLHCPFESLIEEKFVPEKGIEAFVWKYYMPPAPNVKVPQAEMKKG